MLDEGAFGFSDSDRDQVIERLREKRVQNFYGETTLELVKLFQERRGEVDERTAKELNGPLEELGAFGPDRSEQQRLVGGQLKRASDHQRGSPRLRRCPTVVACGRHRPLRRVPDKGLNDLAEYAFALPLC